MLLYFIRHGQTDWNIEGKIQGSYDTELNSTGIYQAEEISNKIIESDIKFSKIYSSKQRRALQTVKIVSDVTNKEYIALEGLEEINFGDWEGFTWKEIREKFPGEYVEWYQKRRYTRPPNGESYQDMLERVLNAVYTIINTNKEDVVIVTHSAVIMCLQCYITNTEFNEMMNFKTDNASITEIDSTLLLEK